MTQRVQRRDARAALRNGQPKRRRMRDDNRGLAFLEAANHLVQRGT